MTAIAIERNTIPGTHRADHELIEAGALKATARASRPLSAAQLADCACAESRAARQPRPVFHWG